MPESTSQELKRLLDLPTSDLLKEFNEARERFRECLRNHGIEIPNMMIVDQGQGPSGEPGRSILLDDFNVQTIKAIDKSVITVYSTADSFVKLFELLPSSSTLEDMTVTVEGKPPCTAKDLSDQLKAGSIPKDSQLVVASSDLKELLPDLEGKPSSPQDKKGRSPAEQPKAATLDEGDLDGIFEGKLPEPAKKPEPPPKPAPKPEPEAAKAPAEEAKSKPAAPEAAAPAPLAHKQMPPSSKIPMPSPLVELSPSISQEDYDALFKSDEEQPLDLSTLGDEAPEQAPAKQPEPDSQKTLSQAELDALLSGPSSATEKPVFPAKKEEPEPSLSQAELDALISGSSESKPVAAEEDDSSKSLSQAELDALLSGPSSATEKPVFPAKKDDSGTSLSQAELDALISGSSPAPSKPKAAAAKEDDLSTSLSQAELDALISGPRDFKPGSDEDDDSGKSLSQAELDALISGSSPSPSKPKAAAAKEDDLSTSLSQAELDALLSGSSPAPSKPKPATPVKAEAPGKSLSQAELDAMLAEMASSKPEPPKEDLNASLSQAELDALIAGMDGGAGKASAKEEPQSLGISQDELDSAISSKPKAPKSFGLLDVADDTEGISQSVIDKAFASSKPPAPKPAPPAKTAKPAKEPELKADISQEELDKLFGGK